MTMPPIPTEDDRSATFARLDPRRGSEPDTPEGNAIDLLLDQMSVLRRAGRKCGFLTNTK